MVFGYYSHPIALFFLVFVVMYFSFSERKFKTLYPYVAVLLILLMFMGKLLLGGNNSQHHDSLYGNLFHSPIFILKELHTYYPYKFFDGHFKQLYRILILLLICSVLLFQIKKGKRVAGLFVLVYSFIYFVVACTSFRKVTPICKWKRYLYHLCFSLQLAFRMELPLSVPAAGVFQG